MIRKNQNVKDKINQRMVQKHIHHTTCYTTYIMPHATLHIFCLRVFLQLALNFKQMVKTASMTLRSEKCYFLKMKILKIESTK